MAIAGGVQGVGGIGRRVKVMGKEGLLFVAGSSGEGLQTPIELEGVGIDDLTLACPRDLEGGGGLSGRGGSAEVESVQGSGGGVQTRRGRSPI